MPTITTLKARADFLRLNRGRKYITEYFILRYAAMPETPATSPQPPMSPCARVGYTVTTKCGNAVTRNRIRRRLRALVREMSDSIKPGTDYVFIARADAQQSIADVEIAQLRAVVERAFEQTK